MSQSVICVTRKRLARLGQHPIDISAAPQLDLFALTANTPIDDGNDDAEAPNSAPTKTLTGADPDDIMSCKALDMLYRFKALARSSV